MKEASLYMLKQILEELMTESKPLNPEFANESLSHVRASMQDGELPRNSLVDSYPEEPHVSA